MTTRRRITEAEAEAIIDRRLWAALEQDRAYQNAESSEAQAAREDTLAEQITRYVHAEFEVTA